jgi:hypothetical protein
MLNHDRVNLCGVDGVHLITATSVAWVRFRGVHELVIAAVTPHRRQLSPVVNPN